MLRKMFDPGDWIAMKPALDPDDTILSLEHIPSPSEVKVRLILGVVVLLGVTGVIYWADDVFITIIFSLFSLFGIYQVIYGVIQSRYEKSMLIDRSNVSVRTKSWLGQRDWKEPIHQYDGVMLREAHMKQNSVGNIDSTKTYHIVELQHGDSGRSVPLHVSSTVDPPREIQEAFAERFHLPALSPDKSEIIARDKRDLDRSLQSRGATPDPGKPPRGVRITEDDRETRITIKPIMGRRAIIVPIFYLAVPLIFGGIVYNIEPEMTYPVMGGVGGFLFLIYGLGWLTSRKKPRDLPVFIFTDGRLFFKPGGMDMPEFITDLADKVMPGRGIPDDTVWRQLESLDCTGIEQIRTDDYTSHAGDGTSHHERLLIESDEGRLVYIAAQHDGKRLAWLKDYILFRLTN